MSGLQCEPHTGTVGSYSPADEDVNGGVNDDDNEEVNDYDDCQDHNKENYDDSTCSLLAAPRMGAASFLYS